MITAESITDEQIRELRDMPRVSGAPAGEDRRLDELFDHALGSNGREACIDRGYSITPHMREQARARCAEILEARRKEGK